MGAPTEVVLNERMRRTAGRAGGDPGGRGRGLVAGGGTALLRSGPALDALGPEGEYGRGVEVVRSCSRSRCTGSRRTPATTATPPSTRSARCRDGHGLDALTGEFGDLYGKGVIDPVRVTRLSLEHAASVAALMLTTEALVAEELIAQPGAIIAPGFGDLAEGLARPSSPI